MVKRLILGVHRRSEFSPPYSLSQMFTKKNHLTSFIFISFHLSTSFIIHIAEPTCHLDLSFTLLWSFFCLGLYIIHYDMYLRYCGIIHLYTLQNLLPYCRHSFLRFQWNQFWKQNFQVRRFDKTLFKTQNLICLRISYKYTYKKTIRLICMKHWSINTYIYIVIVLNCVVLEGLCCWFLYLDSRSGF